MKRCPQCNRVETDDSLVFCRADGVALVSESLPASDARAATVGTPATEIATSILPHATDANFNRETAPTTVLPAQAPAHTGALSNPKRRKTVIAVVAIATSALAVVSALIVNSYLSRNSGGAIESIAVLPFENRSSSADMDYLCDGLAESLIYRLSQLPNLKVSPTSSVMRYKGKGDELNTIANELSVRAVLTGRLVQRGDNLTISLELIDVRNKRLLWGEQYDRRMSELLATQREIAREIVDKLKLKVTGQEPGLTKHYTESNEAYQLYLKGRFYFNKRNETGLQKSLEYYQQAIEKDPAFALAYTGLADTYALLGSPESGGSMSPNETLPKAKAAAMKALEIDESLAEPHVSLALVKYQYDRDWMGADREFKRAIELNPNYPLAHHWYAIYLAGVDRHAEALAEIKRAHELDPLSLPIAAWLGRMLDRNGKSDEAIVELLKAIELDPNFVMTHRGLGNVYENNGRYKEAIAKSQEVAKLAGVKPTTIADLARTYALAGQRDEAEKYLNQLLQLSKQQYVSPTSVAMIYVALGDKDKAFKWLDDADKAHDLNLMLLKSDARLAMLRSDSRFAELVRRIGLPELK